MCVQMQTCCVSHGGFGIMGKKSTCCILLDLEHIYLVFLFIWWNFQVYLFIMTEVFGSTYILICNSYLGDRSFLYVPGLGLNCKVSLPPWNSRGVTFLMWPGPSTRVDHIRTQIYICVCVCHLLLLVPG